MGHWAGLDGCRKSRPPSGFDPGTAQPIGSHYADRAIPALDVNLQLHENLTSATEMTLPAYPQRTGCLYPLRKELSENEHFLMLWGRKMYFLSTNRIQIRWSSSP